VGAERGQILSHYRLVEKIGEGGMGVVWKAEDTVLSRTVAIKVLPADLALDEERRRMFLDEARLAASVAHGNIAQVYELGREGDLDFIVMEHVEGLPLGRLLHGRPVPPEKVADWGLQVAQGLARAHRKGLLHRDLKPGNILITSDGEAKIVDFGLAVLFSSSDSRTGSLVSTLTETARSEAATRIAGTLPYMSPEQVQGEKLDARSDIFSFGTVLYEMTTGERPFLGRTPAEVAQEILRGQPKPVLQQVPKVPLVLHQIIEKTLARRPEDRYQHMDDVAVDLRRLRKDLDSGSSPAYEVPKPKAARPVRRWALAAGAAAAIALTFAWWWFVPKPIPHPPDPRTKAWILVAEFDGPAADSSVVAATRDLVIAALDQSEIVATVPRDQIRVALQSAGRPSSTRVDAELARELAYRSAVRTVLEGRVGRLGKGYSIVLRAADVDSARVLVSVSDAAKDEDALIPTVERIAKRLRAELGEHQSTMQATPNLVLSITPSFEAFKTFQRAGALIGGGDNRAAITCYRSALGLDPDYAGAWLGLGYAFGNLGKPDSALAAFREALVRPERLSEESRLSAAATVKDLSGDLAGALAASEQNVQLAPQSMYAHLNRSAYLASAGRLNEALESARAAERVSPFGPNQLVLIAQFWDLLWLGRVDEARALVPRFQGGMALEAPIDIAAAAGQWSAAESLATVLRSTPSADDDIRQTAATVLAAVQASRGEVTAADRTLRQAQSVAEADREALSANQLKWTRLALTVFSQGPAAAPGEMGQWDSTTAGLVTRGQWAAAAGDTILARRLLATVRTRSAPDISRQGFTPALLEAWIAARGGRWQEVLDRLGPAALQGEAMGYVLLQSAPLMRWMVAEAYDRLGLPDSAAAYFERAIAPPPRGGRDLIAPRMAFSFGHQRLMLLHARMGRLQEARRHWEIFQQTFTDPDPELHPMLDEARQALARAEAKP
jgi:eukaryotic-like serine/threonine-protein kinase